jgi:hypothetical protein
MNHMNPKTITITLMKTHSLEQMSPSFGGSCRIAWIAVCLVLLLASVHLVRGQVGFTLAAGTNSYNFYDSNGTTSDGTALAPPFNGQALSPFPYFHVTGIVFNPPYYSQIIALSPWNTGANTIYATAIPNAYAAFILGNYTIGGQPGALVTGDVPNHGGVGLTLFLSNPASTPYEIRLDWGAIYYYSATGPMVTVGDPNSPLQATVSGTLVSSISYYALAGGETIQNLTSGNTTTATFGAGGSPGDHFTLATSPLNTAAGVFWNGAVGPNNGANAYINQPTAPFSGGGVAVNPSDGVYVQGFLELVVDPGTITVQLQSLLPPPNLGIGTYSNLPAVFYPSNPGTNYILQTTSSLTGSNWVTVSNGIPISGYIIPNPTSPAFFRLN